MPQSIFAKTPPEKVFVSVCRDSPAGSLLVGLTEDGALCRLSFLATQSREAALGGWKKEWAKTFFSETDDKSRFSTLAKRKILLAGTAFQHKVWKALLALPAGKTESYVGLARRIGHPKAARAVGGALGKNPVPLIVPCHRILSANGGIGGFSGGLAVKRLLLTKEKAPFSGQG